MKSLISIFIGLASFFALLFFNSWAIAGLGGLLVYASIDNAEWN